MKVSGRIREPVWMIIEVSALSPLTCLRDVEMCDKILIANRGEIALRVLRACKSSAYHRSRAFDRPMRMPCTCASPNERRVQRGGLRPSRDSYLNIRRYWRCEIPGADAGANPGYAFSRRESTLAENRRADIHFIRAEPGANSANGRQDGSQAHSERLGLPVVRVECGLSSMRRR